MTSWLSELKVTSSFYLAFKILDNVTATTVDISILSQFDEMLYLFQKLFQPFSVLINCSGHLKSSKENTTTKGQ
jgi:hypothetical protein